MLVEAGDYIPGDGEVIEGAASVDESAITGESAPVIRESGGDFSSVTGGTRVLSDWIIVRITANPGETFIDRMIAMVESAKRQKTPNEIALTILLVALTLVFLFATATLLPYSLYSVAVAKLGTPITITALIALLVCLIPTTIGGTAVRDRRGGHEPHDAGECHRHLRPRGGGGRRRGCAAARQDRHDHARQSAGGDLHPGAGRDRRGAGGRRAAGLARRRDARRAQHRRAREAAVQPARARSALAGRDVRAVLRAHAHERRRTSASARSARAPPTPSRSRSRRWARYFPRAILTTVQDVARRGSTPLLVSDGARVLGIIELKDIVKGGIKERFGELRRMGIKTVMITGDNPLTAAAIAAEAGVDDFLAEATPEAKLAPHPRAPGARADWSR